MGLESIDHAMEPLTLTLGYLHQERIRILLLVVVLVVVRLWWVAARRVRARVVLMSAGGVVVAVHLGWVSVWIGQDRMDRIEWIE